MSLSSCVSLPRYLHDHHASTARQAWPQDSQHKLWLFCFLWPAANRFKGDKVLSPRHAPTTKTLTDHLAKNGRAQGAEKKEVAEW